MLKTNVDKKRLYTEASAFFCVGIKGWTDPAIEARYA